MSSSHIALETFQASDFDVAVLVEGLMEEDVRKAKAQGGGEYSLWICCSLELVLYACRGGQRFGRVGGGGGRALLDEGWSSAALRGSGRATGVALDLL